MEWYEGITLMTMQYIVYSITMHTSMYVGLLAPLTNCCRALQFNDDGGREAILIEDHLLDSFVAMEEVLQMYFLPNRETIVYPQE